MKWLKYLFFLMVNFSFNFAKAQDGWSLKQEEAGIKVFSRHSEKKFVEIKVELTITATLSDIAAVLLDINNYPQWSYNNIRSYILKQLSGNDIYFYSEVKTAWPASNRDLVVHQRIKQDSLTKVMTVISTSVPDFIPPKKDLVRVPFSNEIWTVVPIDKTKCSINYYLQIDPGGNAPAWLINLFSTKAPLESFKKFSIQVKQPKYRQATISFIRN